MCLLVDVAQSNMRQNVERVLLEVVLLEVGVHIDAGGAEVVGSGDVRNDALAALPDPNNRALVPWCRESQLGRFVQEW